MVAVGLPRGPAKVRFLAGIDPDLLDNVDRVTLLREWEKVSRWVAAQHARAVVGVAGRRPWSRDDVDREHVSAALRGMGGSVRACVDTARALAGPLAAARAAMERGEISDAHARVIAQETASLPAGAAVEVTEGVLERAGRQTPAQLRRTVRRAVDSADPEAAETAEARASVRRGVSKHVEPDGQASLSVTGPAVEVMTVWGALTARAARTGADDPRTLDQRRFDALVDLAGACPCADGPADSAAPDSAAPSTAPDGGGPAAAAGSRAQGARCRAVPTVHLFADAATWAGLADEPVELDGYGPIPAGAARAYFASSTWRAIVTDALTQRPISVGDPGYRPSARTRRLLHARDRTCIGIGCTAPVIFCDADHNQPHDAGGCTDVDNCGLLCRRHHRIKTFTDWAWQREPDDTITWTAPTGHTYTRDPHRYPMPEPTQPPPDEKPPADEPGHDPPETDPEDDPPF